MPKFEVKSPIQFDGKRHEIGEVVEMSAKVAAPLVAIDCVAPVTEAKTTTGSGNSQQTDNGADTAPTDPAERIEKIKAVIVTLDKEDKNAWTKDGRPNLDALEARLSWRPTAGERDQAFAETQPSAPTE